MAALFHKIYQSEPEKNLRVLVPRIKSVLAQCQHIKSTVMASKCDESFTDESDNCNNKQ